ncbi:MAG: hypothetical protein WCM76_07220 [Bacteroidota bacterium]
MNSGFVKYPILLLLALLTVSCNRTKKEYYDDGALKSEITISHGLKNGMARWYWPNGVLQMECNYSDDKINGPFTRYFLSGKIELQENFTADKRNGTSICRDASGYKLIEQNYCNDSLDGAYREFYPDGTVKIDGQYKHGLYNGTWKYYDSSGILIGQGEFTLGSGIQRGMTRTGKTTRTIQYKNNLKDGEETWYNEDGSVEKVVVYREGKQVIGNR